MDLVTTYFKLMGEKHGFERKKDVVKHLNTVLNRNIPDAHVSNWSNVTNPRNVPRDVARYMRAVVIMDFIESRELKLSKQEREDLIDSLSPILWKKGSFVHAL